MTNVEVCELAEQAYDLGLLKPTAGTYYSCGCGCAIGAAAAMRLHNEGKAVDQRGVIAGATSAWTAWDFDFLKFTESFDRGLCDFYNHGPVRDDDEVAYKFGQKMRKKFSVGV